MTFNLDNIKVSISNENNGIRLTTEDETGSYPDRHLMKQKLLLQRISKLSKTILLKKVGNNLAIGLK